jgi:hypothetical protein
MIMIPEMMSNCDWYPRPRPLRLLDLGGFFRRMSVLWAFDE